MPPLHRTPPLAIPPDYGAVTRISEAERDTIDLEREAEEFGVEVEQPEELSLLPPEPLLHDEDEKKIRQREEVHRELLRQARERMAKVGNKETVKRGKRGRVVGTWMSIETLDTLGDLSVRWEMSRTKVIVQLVRQAKGTDLKQWHAPVPGEYEQPNKMVRPEDNVKIHQRKL